ncbi:hypothetical protein JOC34_004071 [Virgibacillus halotolerans]|uniref:DUF3813 family protein n=1 Tax=Virgibacillus halotolerans TaxID=1071053 RepID=UPI00195F3971|nr:DUF3813 family protein [Virgibacillus halotolerans]MBM7601643.1 hypothetical protein [Virgibacillus halotolerans]
MEDNHLFQQAKDAVMNFMNMQGTDDRDGANEIDQEAAQNAIQAAYNDASPEEQQQLQQLEQQLKESNQLK